ncbi:hypothetical protein D8674_012463 [Pyrus ussuriensis x Pyrus communis]|uniref:Uncharacterized protein n=1 Tax=Pyrus ussuriensis x Pyrus communis TaxID=2448454 RepID=A0A5N5G1M3_9ROSA|nr:hypothetical protein D8674_012463 [Pyrus ussuriensis x Pyrus communis]
MQQKREETDSVTTGSEAHCGESHRGVEGDDATEDTTSSPIKKKSSDFIDSNGLMLAEKIRARKKWEEEERRATEKALDEGLIGPGGKVAPGIENVVLLSLEEVEEGSPEVVETARTRVEIDLNLMPREGDESVRKKRFARHLWEN